MGGPEELKMGRCKVLCSPKREDMNISFKSEQIPAMYFEAEDLGGAEETEAGLQAGRNIGALGNEKPYCSICRKWRFQAHCLD